jgi:ribosomal protein L10
MQDNDKNLKNDIVIRIISKLESMAIPMDYRDFSKDEYRKVFPQGVVKTPIGEVKIGRNQFTKLAEKDNGNRKGLIGAMRQTLSDPIVIITEEAENRKAYIFLKSFNENEKLHIIVSVVVTIDGNKVAISTYKRKRREVISKIKKAGVITYEKGYGAGSTNGF